MSKPTRHILTSIVSFLVIALFLAGPALAQTERIVPKAENFVFFVDHSGSMAMSAPSDIDSDLAASAHPLKQEKIEVVKEILAAINNDIPEMDVNAGLYTYGPFREYLGVTPYSKAGLGQGIDALQENYEVYGRLTPMGLGLQSLDPVLSGLSDRKAVILTTDGESNIGAKPLPIVQDMYARYGDSICFHVISFAQTRAEQALVEQIAAINPCTVSVDGMDLLDDAKRAEFMRKVFYDIEIIPPAPVEPVEEVIVFRSVHFDFDKSNIKPEFVPVLKEAAEMIKARPGRTVMVEGHTCNIGPAVYNQGLSERRAASVRNFLIDEGVESDRLQAVGYGLNNPKYDNNTREGRSLNRRVELRFE